VHGPDIPALAGALNLLPGEFIRKYTRKDYLGHRHLVLKRNGDCIFYEEGRCIVNEVKPAACCAWPFWKGVCTTKRGWERASKRCPGIGKGRVWRTREIASMLAWSP
jgi:Fe-S-cluster containining protein